MGGILQVDTIQNNNATTLITQTNSTTLTFGVSGQNIVIPSGVTFNTASATVNYPAGSITNADIASAAAIATSKLGAGAVLQVITATDSTHRSTTSTTFVTGSNALSVSITPSSASNKVFIIVNSTISNGSGDGFVFTTIYRGATNLGEATNGIGIGNSVPGVTHIDHPACITILDSPNTTSATTYQLYFRSDNASRTASLNGRSGTVVKGSITAFEIAG